MNTLRAANVLIIVIIAYSVQLLISLDRFHKCNATLHNTNIYRSRSYKTVYFLYIIIRGHLSKDKIYTQQNQSSLVSTDRKSLQVFSGVPRRKRELNSPPSVFSMPSINDVDIYIKKQI